MSAIELAAWAQAVFGLGAFGAACLAVRAAYAAPRLAAEFAERLRKESAAADEARKQKLEILETLLKHRATFEYPEAVHALNLITIVFMEEQEVRDAYSHFLKAAEITLDFDHGRLKERYLAIIEKIVRTLGMNDKIKVQDVNEGYYPRFLAKQSILYNKDVNDRFDAAFPGQDKPSGQ